MVQAGIRVILLMGLYLVFAGQISSDEVVAGGVCGAAIGLASFVVRRRGERQFAFSGSGWHRMLARVAVRLPVETWRVGARLLRPSIPPGTLQSRPGLAAGYDPRARAARAVATLGTSLTPNSYVVAERPARQESLMHALVADEAPPQ